MRTFIKNVTTTILLNMQVKWILNPFFFFFFKKKINKEAEKDIYIYYSFFFLI